MTHDKKEPREYAMYVPAVFKGEEIHGYDTMEECCQKHNSGMLVAHHEIFDEFEALKLENESLQSQLDDCMKNYQDLGAHISKDKNLERLQKENESLRAALEKHKPKGE